MFIPIGFGNFLRKFPAAILLLSLAIGLYSYWYFPTIKSIHSAAAKKSFPLQLKGKLLIEDIKKSKSKKTLSFWEKINDDFATNSQFKKSPDEWSEDLKSSKLYPEFQKEFKKSRREFSEAYSQHHIANPLLLTPLSLMHSTFLHADWMHLIGNLALLILVGVWIEQRLGKLHALAIFFTGSLAGLAASVLIDKSNIIGASAGVYSIMGAFLALFYHTQMRFIFTIIPPFFFKITLPTLWTFPFIFLISEFLEIGAVSKVAHLAHAVGAVVGFGYAYYYRVEDNLRNDQLFKPEIKFEKYLKNAKTAADVWKGFYTIMRWNSQNKTAVKLFLEKAKEVNFQPTPKQKKFLTSNLLFMSSLIFKYGEEPEIKEWVTLLPKDIEPVKVLKTVPLKQLLTLADSMAQQESWAEATFFYQACLKKRPSKRTAINIQAALTEIERLTSKENPDECSA